MPVIKIRHSNNLTTTAATLNTSASNAVSITPHLYNFTMSNEITVQPGDILMIESDTTNQVFYQQYNGPHNYRLGDNNELIALDINDYPLISVVVGKTNFYLVLLLINSPIRTHISNYHCCIFQLHCSLNHIFNSYIRYHFTVNSYGAFIFHKYNHFNN